MLQREIYWNGLQDLVWVASNNGLHTGGTENHPVPAQPTRVMPGGPWRATDFSPCGKPGGHQIPWSWVYRHL